jgi:hypothetical protein
LNVSVTEYFKVPLKPIPLNFRLNPPLADPETVSSALTLLFAAAGAAAANTSSGTLTGSEETGESSLTPSGKKEFASFESKAKSL